MNKRYLRDSKCQSLFVSEKLYDFTIPPYTLYMQYTNAIKRDFITDLRLSLTIIHETDDFENGYIATGIIAQIVFDDCGLWNIKEIDSISNNLQL